MKKQFLGIFALILAIGLSAFTLPKNKTSAELTKFSPQLYWYEYDQVNDKIVGYLIAYAEQEDVKTGTCTQDDGSVECRRGYLSPLPAYWINVSPAPMGESHIYLEDIP